jgi:hypothetical protein
MRRILVILLWTAIPPIIPYILGALAVSHMARYEDPPTERLFVYVMVSPLIALALLILGIMGVLPGTKRKPR